MERQTLLDDRCIKIFTGIGNIESLGCSCIDRKFMRATCIDVYS